MRVAVHIAVLLLAGLCCPACAEKTPEAEELPSGQVAIVYSPDYLISLAGLEKLHPFDINKYEKIIDSLVADGVLREQDIHYPETVYERQLLRVHTPEYLESMGDSRAVAAYLEAPAVSILSAETIDRAVLSAFRKATGGSILATALALRHGVGINLAGGYHHAKPDVGEGFCVYNDIAVAIREMQDRELVRRVLVIDLDVHQGNGTAVAFAGDRSVFTFSMHQKDIYPEPKEESDLDVEVSSGMGDADYLRILGEHLPGLFRPRPDLVVYQAGCDVLDGDPLASLELTVEGLIARDAMVIDKCVAQDIPDGVLLALLWTAPAPVLSI